SGIYFLDKKTLYQLSY
ncbi:hypothetical protein VN97_g13170, partial [Penicillium thymicola]